MFGSDIIEVAIGMAFLYLFMSMIASALREALEAKLKKRAVDLERGLREMLRTDTTSATAPPPRGLTDILRGLLPTFLVGTTPTHEATFNSWANHFYAHPLVASLFVGTYEQAKTDGTLPSYIPKENFSLALLDLVAGASADGKELSLDSLKAALSAADPPNDVQRVVLTAIATGQNDLHLVRKGVEDWYDATMDRVTGWYARRTALILFLFGLVAAVALNVDSISVVKSLLTDRPLRQAIVAKAEAYAKDHKDGPGAPPTDAPDSVEHLRTEMDEVGFPIGWTTKEGWWMPIPQSCIRRTTAEKKAAKPDENKDYACSRQTYVPTMLLAAMGWLITAIAIMLGAPFWFDMLNKLISIRSALKPPDDPTPPKKKKSGGGNGGGGGGGRRRGAGGGAPGGQAPPPGGQVPQPGGQAPPPAGMQPRGALITPFSGTARNAPEGSAGRRR